MEDKMRKILGMAKQFLLFKLIGYQKLESIILTLSRFFTIDILMLSYTQMGILKFQNEEVSGESFVVNSFLKKHFQDKQDLVLFDVGANVGEYSVMLNNAFPKSLICAFEPNFNTFKVLSQTLGNLDVKPYQLGLGSKCCNKKMYTYSHDHTSGHASVYKDVLTDLHRANEIIEIDFEITNVDTFCEKNHVYHIDFMKIDTEGHELEVLIGAADMISNKKIDIIQFEFNEMNIVSRVFLKDFYTILSDYNLYRLDSSRLIPLLQYQSKNEIFQFQNFLAIRKEIEINDQILFQSA
jgi:FkbM family methyltransferase